MLRNVLTNKLYSLPPNPFRNVYSLKDCRCIDLRTMEVLWTIGEVEDGEGGRRGRGRRGREAEGEMGWHWDRRRGMTECAVIGFGDGEVLSYSFIRYLSVFTIFSFQFVRSRGCKSMNVLHKERCVEIEKKIWPLLDTRGAIKGYPSPLKFASLSGLTHPLHSSVWWLVSDSLTSGLNYHI